MVHQPRRSVGRTAHPFDLTTDGLVIRADHLPEELIPQIGYDQADVKNMGSYRYYSGVLQNKDVFSQRYGYFEAEVKLPAGKGLWPAFWLLPSSGNWPPEIDVFELLGHEPNRLYTTTHYNDQGHKSMHVESWNDFTSWHKIGVLWEPEKLTLYVDGNEAGGGVIPNRIDEPMYMLLNLAVGGSWPGNPDESTKFPAEMLVKSVRAYALR